MTAIIDDDLEPIRVKPTSSSQSSRRRAPRVPCLAGAVIALLFIGLPVGRDALIRAEAVPIPAHEQTFRDSWPVDNAYRDDDTGEMLSMDHAGHTDRMGVPLRANNW